MSRMRSGLIGLFLLSVISPGLAQTTTPATPVRVCVAQLRNRTPNNFDVVKLRQLLTDGIKQTSLGKSGRLSLLTIEVAESEDALAAVQSQQCVFAVYTRLLQQAPVEHTNVDVSGEITYRSSPVEKSQFLMGVQCTVEQTGNTIPALIDRQYSKTPVLPQPGIEKMLSAEAQRIADAIEKKLSTSPK
jgi:hypothetical protein